MTNNILSQRNRLVWLAVMLAVISLGLVIWRIGSSSSAASSPLPNLQGAATIEHLKQQGLYPAQQMQARFTPEGVSQVNCADATLVAFSNLRVNGQMYRYRVTPTSATLDLTFAHPDLQFPHHGIVIPTTGDLLVSDKGTDASGNISSFLRFKNPLGAMTYSGKFNTPDMILSYWLAIRNNELFVPQGVNNILRFFIDANGNLTPNGIISNGLANETARGIVLTPWGELFVTRCSDNYIVRYKFDANGNASLNGTISGNGLSNPHGMAFSSWGELFVASHDNNTVSRFTFDANRNASANGQIANADLQGPIDVAFSPWGELFASNNMGATVTRFRFDSARNAAFSGSFDTPSALHGLLFLQPSSVCTLPPTVTTLGVTSQAGSPAVNAQLGTAIDYEDAEEILQLQISSDGTNFGSTATLNGVTVTLTDSNAGATGINPNSTGQIFANIVAACGASNASFTLKVADSGGLMTTTPFTITVNANTPPLLSYNNPAAIVFGMTTTVSPSMGPSDNGNITGFAVQSKGTFTGDVSVNSSGVVTISNAGPVGTHAITIRATDNCNQATDAAFNITVSSCTNATLVTFSNLRANARMYRYQVTPTTASLDLTVGHSELVFPHHGIVIPATGDLLVSQYNGAAGGDFLGSFLRYKDPLGAMTYDSRFTTSDMNLSFWLAIRNNELFVPQGVNNMLRFLLDANGNLTPNGSITDGLVGGTARGIVLTPWGELFVTRCCNNNQIVRYKFDANGNASLNGTISGNGLSNPHGMAFSSWGELFVASHDNNIVSRFTFDANRNASANGQIINAAGLAAIDVAFSPWGELFISNNLGAKITRFRFDGARNATFSGSFDTPSALHGLLFLQPSSVCTLPPTVTTLGVTSQAGSPAINAQLGTAIDYEDTEEILQLQISSDGTNFGNTATLNGVTVTLTDSNAGASGINPNVTGQVFADVVAACGARNANFTLKVTDSGGAMTTVTSEVAVSANTPPTLSYNNPPALIFSNGATVNPATGPSDNGSIASIVVQSVSPSTAPGMITVNNSSGVVTVSNNIPPGSYTVTIRATDNCGSPSGVTDGSFALTVQPIDYTVTTAGNAIVVTDVSGNGDVLSVTEPSAGNIKFAAAGRNFQINGGATISGDSGNLPLAGVNSITVNQGNGNDTANVGAFTFNLPSLTINGGIGDDTVNLNGDVTFAANANLDVDLQNDDLSPGIDTVNVATDANLLASGSGTIVVKTSRLVRVFNGGSLEVVNGNLTVEANQQAIPTSGDFSAVTLNGLLKTSGTGNVVVRGRSGANASVGLVRGVFLSGSGGGISSTNAATGAGNIEVNGVCSDGYMNGCWATVVSNNSGISSAAGAIQVTGFGSNGAGGATASGSIGVLLNLGGRIDATGSAPITISATSGNVTTGSSYGFLMSDSGTPQINAVNGSIQITGQSGSAPGAISVANSIGTYLTTDSIINATGSGSITIQGTSGDSGIGASQGVRVQPPSQINSANGDINLIGVGGAGTSGFNHGVTLRANVTASGAGNITVNGTAGVTGTSGSNGVNMRDGAVVSANNGNVLFTGASAGTAGNEAVNLASVGTSTISISDATKQITIVGDTLAINTTNGSVNAGTSTVNLRQKTNGAAIDLGAADAPMLLGLTDAELDRVTAGTLNIGNANSGAIAVSAAITRPVATIVNLTSGGAINLNTSSLDSAGGNVTLTPGTLVNPAAIGADVSLSTTGTLAFANGADLAITINGTTPDVQYTQLNVIGGVNLNGVDLALGGLLLPVVGQSFVVVNNDGNDAIIGAFNGLPQGALIPNFLGSGLNAQISYTGGTGNDAVITVLSPILSISKSSPVPALAIGQNSAYTITVINSGNAVATTATVKEAIPSGFDLISAAGTNWICSPSSGNDPVGIITCNFTGGSIAVGGGISTIVVTVKPKASFCGTSVMNKVSVDPTGGANPPNPTTCTALNSPSAGCGAPVVSPVTNNAPTLSYNNATVNSGASITVNPVTGPADDGSVNSIAVQSVGGFNGTVTVNNLTGVVSISNTGASGTINPNHPTEVISLSNAGTCGVFTITIRITDNCGLIRDAAFTLTANDTMNPVLASCPANITQPAASGSCSAAVTFTAPSANDNCGAPTVTCVPASGATFNLGTTTVTCTARDAANNSASCSFTVTINDAQAPTIAACTSNVSANTATDQCAAVVTYAVPTATDNCAGTPVVTCSPGSGSSFAKGTTTVTCTATDAAKNSSQCSFTVTVTDGQNPTISCPANQSALSTNGNPVAVTYPAPTVSDNCPGVMTACVPASGSNFAVGTTTVTCTATDTANRTAACSFTVTVGSCASIVCPADIFTATATTTRVVNYPLPTANGTCGTITCTPAPGSTFNLGTTTVSCSSSIGNQTCAFRVTVNRITASANDPLVCTGPGNTVQATLVMSNNGTVNQTVNDTTTFTNLVGVPNSCVTTPNVGTCVVTNGGLTYSGTLTPGQTVTLTYLTQVSSLAPVGAQVCTNNSVVFSGGPAFAFSVCEVIDCPAIGPGNPTTAGSVLIYNVFTSGAASSNTQNTRINVTNSHPTLPAFVHLFFVAESCSVADSYVCLTANQTTSFLASDLDPGTTGYLVAVATDSRGCPINFNYLIGDEYVKFASGHAANLAAESFAALAGGLPACDGQSVTATLNFDGVSYNRSPAVLALSNVGSRADGNDTLLIVNRIGGNLGTGAATLGTLFGILYDDAENALSFSVTGSCQLRSSLSNTFPRTTPRFETFIPAGRTGWLKIFNQTGAIGLTGAAINSNANAASSAGAFNQGHNLHWLTLNNQMNYIIPVFPPSC